ncbi:restriction endonuclease subunit S [Sporolactobacillus pectinivorans]|uniref:restriction endonuclease subunit S n=1 Tax=Sporolactobacillus pectinivorans TaxID=1591408 RepID=UPI000C2574EA|nr:restriction endonuclease subunit S [Sporolactobacillus pectinivorans]
MEYSQVRLGKIAEYVDEKVSINSIDLTNYVSTENLVSNIGGVELASKLPEVKKVTSFGERDILISNIRPYFKKIWLADRNGGCSNDVLVIRANSEVNASYLYYNLVSDNFFDYVMAGAKGTKMPRGDKKHILNYEVKLPSLELQDSIANILSTLDDKIEVNTQINKTLEMMAQEIFKHWFVDFEFPNENGEPYQSSGGEMVESELGMIPEGWKVEELDDICDISSSKRIFMNEYVNEGIPFYRGKEIIEKSKGSIISTELYISLEKYNEIKEKHSVPVKGDILLTSVGTLGVPFRVTNEKFYFKDGNLTWFRNYAKKEFSNYIYSWLVSSEGKKSLDSIKIGSTQKALTIASLKKLRLIICEDTLLIKFENIMDKFMDRMSCNNNEKAYLMNLRNALLPKLMSGEIRVSLEKEGVVQ